MEIKEFLKAATEICRDNEACKRCPIEKFCEEMVPYSWTDDEFDEFVAIVEGYQTGKNLK